MGIKTKSENRKGNLNHFAAKSKQIDKLQIGTVTKLIHWHDANPVKTACTSLVKQTKGGFILF